MDLFGSEIFQTSILWVWPVFHIYMVWDSIS